MLFLAVGYKILMWYPNSRKYLNI